MEEQEFQELFEEGQAAAEEFFSGLTENPPAFVPEEAISDFQQFFENVQSDSTGEEMDSNLPEPVVQGVEAQEQFIQFGYEQFLSDLEESGEGSENGEGSNVNPSPYQFSFEDFGVGNNENDPITGSGSDSGQSSIPGVEFNFAQAGEEGEGLGQVVANFDGENVSLFTLGAGGPSFSDDQGSFGGPPSFLTGEDGQFSFDIPFA